LTRDERERINAIGVKVTADLEAIRENEGTSLAFWQEFVRNLSKLIGLVKPFADGGTGIVT
jgi:hypothetical protein